MTNQPNYILVVAPIAELAQRVNERWDDYEPLGAPFVAGANVCQAMVKHNDSGFYTLPAGRASSVVYNIEVDSEPPN